MRFLIIALFFCFSTVFAQEDVVRIGENTINTKDLADFSNDRITMSVRGQVQGFSGSPLEALVRVQLLVQEGKKLGIAPPDDPKLNKDIFYAIKVLNEIAPKCDKPSIDKIKNYYEENIHSFSTPLFVRLSRISLAVTENRNRDSVFKAFEEIKKALKNNNKLFSDIARTISEDQISRKRDGDIGFIPVLKEDIENNHPFFSALQKAAIDDIIGPIEEQNNMFSIYQVTDKKEPIADPFGQVQGLAEKGYLTSCREEKINSVVQGLKKKYNIQYLKNG